MMRVRDLKIAIAGLPDDLPVFYSDYENLSGAGFDLDTVTIKTATRRQVDSNPEELAVDSDYLLLE